MSNGRPILKATDIIHLLVKDTDIIRVGCHPLSHLLLPLIVTHSGRITIYLHGRGGVQLIAVDDVVSKGFTVVGQFIDLSFCDFTF